MERAVLEEGTGKFRVKAIINFCGSDINVSIVGGEKEHIGAVALAQPRKSLSDATRISATTSVICAMGHKEDDIAKIMAETLAKEFNCIVVATAGIHVENASLEDINKININFKKILERIKLLNIR